MSAPLLAFEGYAKSVRGRPVLLDASVSASPGRVTALLGRVGTGKSALVRAGLGLIRSERGATRWGGETLARPRLHEMATSGLFFLPERGLLSRRLRLAQQLDLYAATFHGDPLRAATDLGLEDLVSLRVGQLSAGEERRAELTLARLRAPSCLVADEPFSRMAPADRAVVGRELVAHARRGAAVLVTGHEMDDLFEIADEVVWMHGGATRPLGSPALAALDEAFRREYLAQGRGVPL